MLQTCFYGKRFSDDVVAQTAVDVEVERSQAPQNRRPMHYRFVVLSISFSVHPLADVRRTVLKLHTLRLATPEKPHCIAIHQP